MAINLIDSDDITVSQSGANIKLNTISVGDLSNLNTDDKTDVVSAINEILSKKTYVYGSQNTITFTAPYSGIIDIEYSRSCWGYGGAEYKMKIENTVGSATQLLYAQDISNGHDTEAVPVRCRAIYRVTKGTEYTFVGSNVGNLGGTKSERIIGKLTP